MGYFISSVIGPRHPPVALHAMYYTRTVFLSTDTLIHVYVVYYSQLIPISLVYICVEMDVGGTEKHEKA